MPNPMHKLTLKPTLKPKLKAKPRPKLLLKPMPNPRHKPKLKREAKPERKVWLIPHTKPMPHISLRFASLSFTELSIISSQPEPLPLLSLRSTLHLYYLYYLYYLSNPSTFNQYLRNIQWIRLTRVRAEHLSEYHISTNRIVRSFVRSFTHNWILPHRSLYLWR